MSLDQETLERLYGNLAGWLPYRLFAWGGESYGMKVMHFPGVQANPIPIEQALEAPFHGYRGLLVQDYAKSLNEQRVRLCWCAVDIDAKDNPKYTFDQLLDRVTDAMVPNDNLLYRCSKSGRGIHLIQRLAPAETTYGHASASAKIIASNLVRALMDAQIMTCVYGIPNLWLWSKGGLQKNLN